MRPLRVVLADDHTLVREGIRRLLEQAGGTTVLGEAGDGHDALRLIEETRPDLALLDIGLPGLNGIEVAARARERQPTLRVVMLTMHASAEYLRQALAAGAHGYVLKDASVPELQGALHAVMRGETFLSPGVSRHLSEAFERRGSGGAVTPGLTSRQREVLQMLAEGLATKEVAHRLRLSPKTVEAHRAQITLEAVRKALDEE